MFESNRYDAVVVGGGPAGIFAAFTLARAGRLTVLLEAGEPMRESLCPKIRVALTGRLVPDTQRYRMQCPRCTCLTGLGGAAFHFDTNLGYSTALRRSKIEQEDSGRVTSFSSLERALNSFDRAEEAIRAVFDTFYAHGLEPARAGDPHGHGGGEGDAPPAELFDGADLSASQSITVDQALTVVDRLMAAFVEAGGEVRFQTRATGVDRGTASRFVVRSEALAVEAEPIEADAVVVAVGKLGLPWTMETIERLGLQVQPSTKVDVGIRLEGNAERMAPLVAACANPKLAFINDRGEAVRTFCVCAGGRIMQYEFGGAVVLDGQHCLTNPTRFSNFGIVTSAKVPAGETGPGFALGIARRVSERGGNRPVACTIGELKQARAGTAPDLGRKLDTSLLDYEHASLAECLPMGLVDDILAMTARLNAAFPGMVSDDAVAAAPVIERISPQLVLSDNMESSEPGLYFVGDSSSRIIGVTYGAATGMIAANDIVRSPVAAH